MISSSSSFLLPTYLSQPWVCVSLPQCNGSYVPLVNCTLILSHLVLPLIRRISKGSYPRNHPPIPLMRLPTLYARTHEFPWYFCDFIRFSNQQWSLKLKPRHASATQPCRLVCASCLPRTASCWVRVRTASDRRHDHSMEHTRSCNVSGLLLMILQHCLSIESSPASHVLI
jgi:hypothetical protein